jgi:hypothetical protein
MIIKTVRRRSGRKGNLTNHVPDYTVGSYTWAQTGSRTPHPDFNPVCEVGRVALLSLMAKTL